MHFAKQHYVSGVEVRIRLLFAPNSVFRVRRNQNRISIWFIGQRSFYDRQTNFLKLINVTDSLNPSFKYALTDFEISEPDPKPRRLISTSFRIVDEHRSRPFCFVPFDWIGKN